MTHATTSRPRNAQQDISDDAERTLRLLARAGGHAAETEVAGWHRTPLDAAETVAELLNAGLVEIDTTDPSAPIFTLTGGTR